MLLDTLKMEEVGGRMIINLKDLEARFYGAFNYLSLK